MKYPERLANAIVELAVKDYRSYLKEMKKRNMFDDNGEIKQEFEHSKLAGSLNGIERFFYSDWFDTLCNLDPDMLIRKLREEVGFD